MSERIGHQSIQDTRVSNAEILENGVILGNARDDEDQSKNWLGDGYYFWENDLNSAHWFGRKQYNNNYVILEVQIKSDNLLDLAGSKTHLIEFSRMVKFLHDEYPEFYYLNEERPTLRNYIEFLREANNETKGLFPYKGVVINYSAKPDKIKIDDNKRRSVDLDLNRIFIICIFNLSEVHLHTLNIVYRQGYRTP